MRRAGLRAMLVACCLQGAAGCAGFAPAQVGQIAGTIAGAAAAPGIGAPLGALIGMLAGAAVQHQTDKVTESRERVDLGRQLNPPSGATQPTTAPAPIGTPTRVWVDETVQDGRLLAGHFDVRALP